MSETMRCRICDQERPVDEFTVYPHTGQRTARCRACLSAQGLRAGRARGDAACAATSSASLPPELDWNQEAAPVVPDVATIKARLLAASRRGGAV